MEIRKPATFPGKAVSTKPISMTIFQQKIQTKRSHFFRLVTEDAAVLFPFALVALFAIEPDVVTRCAKSRFADDQLPVRVAALLADFITEDF
jgi:cbb3-type cytochrome oxidase subunit 1